MSSKTKFIYETFSNKGLKLGSGLTSLIESTGNNIENGEKIIDLFSCAIRMKILIQGKLYVSDQALYFHSPFTDSIIFFSKETKIKVPLS